MEFRHEWKHEICHSDLLALRARLGAVLERDRHAVNGSYEIRSLYFDNLRDKALREKLDGVNGREKFRVRYYNGDLSQIFLEKKSKYSGLCRKEQARLNWEEVQVIARGDAFGLEGSEKPLVQELRFKMITQGLRPRTIVDYTRESFVYPPGNVRVTLDHHIRTALGDTDFLEPDCVTVPAGDAPAILEVKWDQFLPSLIRDLVQVPRTHTSAFSKYAACRIYG
ncbi:polyphosphate polymerase domain-containing protein [Pseudoflavonifractor phocaeensis]|uniref:polyphosphate polymerase domain-containing protein n=1 Tax=Pseudoflavonifractor phocaeensis TaxID=1870988 RepID=UPI0025A4BA8C|nr:polyphosphate polymerase domain-containing protein [Pseudoflavonifractor phocaeensis]MDM8239304.1 polyphosphate polymerase domain-containing protein [Pseudoflavonifractor phocaeensis]